LELRVIGEVLWHHLPSSSLIVSSAINLATIFSLSNQLSAEDLLDVLQIHSQPPHDDIFGEPFPSLARIVFPFPFALILLGGVHLRECGDLLFCQLVHDADAMENQLLQERMATCEGQRLFQGLVFRLRAVASELEQSTDKRESKRQRAREGHTYCLPRACTTCSFDPPLSCVGLMSHLTESQGPPKSVGMTDGSMSSSSSDK
jgi:hypothetical protein